MRFAGAQEVLSDLRDILFSNERMSMQDLWGAVLRDRDSFLIDPVALSAALGPASYQRVAREAADYEASRARETIDKGSGKLDILLHSLGINSNISGVAKPPTVYYPIAEDAFYKRQYKAPGKFMYTYQGEPGTVVEYINLTNTPMADWDVPDASHQDANVTVRNLGDVEDLVRDYVKVNPQSHLRLYQTPGGYRAWELGERRTPAEFGDSFAALNVDPDYALLTNRSIDRVSDWNASGASAAVPFDPPGFSSRISHKPGRTDWVAQPIAVFKGKEALVDPRSRFLVNRLHDEPIRQHYLSKGPTPGVNPDAMAALQRQLPTVSAPLRRSLQQRFGL